MYRYVHYQKIKIVFIKPYKNIRILRTNTIASQSSKEDIACLFLLARGKNCSILQISFGNYSYFRRVGSVCIPQWFIFGAFLKCTPVIKNEFQVETPVSGVQCHPCVAHSKYLAFSEPLRFLCVMLLEIFFLWDWRWWYFVVCIFFYSGNTR